MSGQPAVPQASPDPAWNRVHPISPLVRGWIAVLAIAYFWGQNWLEDVFAAGDESRDASGELRFTPDLLLTVGIGLAILLLIVFGFFLSWWFTKYQVTERHVNVNSGILFRQQRQARIDRVQAIDIAQPLLARIFGLAELKFEVADAGATAVSLAFLKIDDAKRLRNVILARAAGLKASAGGAPASVAHAPGDSRIHDADVRDTGDRDTGVQGGPGTGAAGPDAGSATGADAGSSNATALDAGEPGRPPSADDAPEAPERTVATVPPGRLIGSLLLTPWVWIAVAAVVAALAAAAATDGDFPVFFVLPLLLAVVPALWGQFNSGYNFRAGMSADGLRMSYGLLDTRHQTVPPGRVQAVQVTQGLLWRRFGWHRVVVNVAGYGGGAGEDNSRRSTLLPVGTRADVLSVLAVVLPDPGTDRPLELIDAGIAGSGPDEGFTTTPRRARLLAPIGWRRQGFAVTGTAILIRTGRMTRRLVMVPHERTQGLVLRQGPLARRAGVCDVQLATTDGPVDPRVVQIGVEDGRELFLRQADRAATARHLRDRDHWLEGGTGA
ncbi:PH domain-containing protein [Arthrobacter halodurans]|uniref:PH domain-containing protein n=1 Tax=Arthrobacter halodurans TaxID=516699 RepID=A0ABV4URC1_9MICC